MFHSLFLGTLSVCLFFSPLLSISLSNNFPSPITPPSFSSLSTVLLRALEPCTFNGSPPLAGEELVWVPVMLAQWWMDRKTKNPSPAFLLLQWGVRVGRILACNHYVWQRLPWPPSKAAVNPQTRVPSNYLGVSCKSIWKIQLPEKKWKPRIRRTGHEEFLEA